MTIEEILKEAIQGETEAHELYTNAQALVQAEHIKALLRELAEEELGHKTALEGMLANPDQIQGQVRAVQQATIEDYKIADHLVVRPLGPDSTFQDVCIFAAQKEQQSHQLYRDLAVQNTGEIRDLLEAMSKDELRHKNLVEGWYEEVIYQEF
ncbi:MAG: ferritin family protein [Anaerolineae bacterium]|jgi:rubrerythrin